ncbi:hypothetical protein [Xanthomonas citri]|uniref:hypothetical protein n=2 Tax=Xanthomonas TaxID=338 RepID=UPI0001CED0DA|nr:hypothetical protein [Xanthomonas citri]EFF49585.1 hypothetical protein XAUC_00130 [Xanthomonas citri pv. aurantifolii str. ICPB 10535]MCC8489494.1 hypothetical protein [Xanthomonas citri pv. fuscans]
MSDGLNSVWSRGLQHASDLLIRRGTAMGPLVPTLFLVPLFLAGAYLLRSVVWLAIVLALTAVGIIFEYFRQYSVFARNDPDRLQSEEYRYEMTKIQIVAGKGLPQPVPLEDLNLSGPTTNPVNPMPSVDSVVIESKIIRGGDA